MLTNCIHATYNSSSSSDSITTNRCHYLAKHEVTSHTENNETHHRQYCHFRFNQQLPGDPGVCRFSFSFIPSSFSCTERYVLDKGFLPTRRLSRLPTNYSVELNTTTHKPAKPSTKILRHSTNHNTDHLVTLIPHQHSNCTRFTETLSSLSTRLSFVNLQHLLLTTVSLVHNQPLSMTQCNY